MPRMKEDVKSILADLTSRLEGLVEAAQKEGRESALAELRAIMGGGGAAKAKRGRPRKAAKAAAPKKAGKKAKKARKGGPRRNPWADMSPEDRLARVNAIRVGRGLPPKDAL